MLMTVQCSLCLVLGTQSPRKSPGFPGGVEAGKGISGHRNHEGKAQRWRAWGFLGEGLSGSLRPVVQYSVYPDHRGVGLVSSGARMLNQGLKVR